MIEITRLLLDFGLCILIWIVIPLMLGQLGIVIYQVFLAQNTFTLISI